MNVATRKTPLVLILILASLPALSQIDISRLELGISAGVLIYQGDLTPSRIGSYRTPGPNLNLFAGYRFADPLSIRLQFALGNVSGNDAAYSEPVWRKLRAFRFSAPLLEASALLVYQPLGREKKITPYVLGGAGLAYLRSRPDASRFSTEAFPGEPQIAEGLEEDQSHGTPRLMPVLPVGLGLQYPLSSTVALTAESSYRLSFTDYVDGFSHSASPRWNDHYLSHTIGVVYRFRKKSALDCPDPRKMHGY